MMPPLETRSNLQVALESGAESIVKNFGVTAQIIKSCEELSELLHSLCKKMNHPGLPSAPIIEEIADSFVMLHQLRFIFGKDLVDEEIIRKLDRTLTNIRTRKKESEESFQ